MTDDGYAALRIAIDRGIARVTIDHPPLNGGATQRLPRLAGRGRALETPEATAAMEGFLAAGGQTRDYERNLGARVEGWLI